MAAMQTGGYSWAAPATFGSSKGTVQPHCVQGKIGEQRQVRVDQFPVASELVNQLMEVVMREARASPTLRTKLFQV